MSLLHFVLLAIAAVPCDGVRLDVVPGEGNVSFTVTQGDAPFSGEFKRFGGHLCRGKDGVSRIDVWLDPASVDSGLPEVDELLRSPAFFRFEEHPRVTFTSKDVERTRMLLEACGDLVINGITRERCVEFRFGEQSDGRWQARGRFTLSRLEHELGRGEWDNVDYLADDVVVEFDATLVPAASRQETQ